MPVNYAFRRNVAIVSLGTIIATAFSFLAEPWVARFWDPQLFGIVSYYNSVLLIISPLLFFRYDFAVVQAKSEGDAHNLFILSLFIGTALILCIALLIIPFRIILNEALSYQAFDYFFLIVLVFSGLSVLLRFWFTRTKDFIQISVSTIILQASFTLLLLIFGFIGVTTVKNIILIRNISYILSPLILISIYLKRDFVRTIQFGSVAGIRKVAGEFKRYPVIEYWGYLASIIGMHIPIILIARFWGLEINGLYTKAFYILYLFALFTGESINRVLHKEIADMLVKREQIGQFLNDLLHGLIKLSILPIIIVILTGPELFGVFLGERWTMSGHFARFIAFWMFTFLLTSSLRPLFGLLDKQPQFTFFKFLMLISRVLTLTILGNIQFDIYYTVIIFSIVNFLIMLAELYFLFKISKVDSWKIIRDILYKFFQMIPLISIVLLVRFFTDLNHLIILMVTFIVSVPYVWIYYLKDITVWNQLFRR